MSNRKLYLFVGAPGSGKTTVADLIHRSSGAVHLWADHHRQDMFDKVDHSPQESKELYDYLNQQTDELLASGKNVVFDTNFNYRKDRDYLRSIAHKHGAETVIIWVKTPLATARQRALHSNHRDRNRYDNTMTAADFDRLVGNLESPTDNEKFIIVDGSDIDESLVLAQLGL